MTAQPGDAAGMRYWTRSVAVIAGWNAQMYANSPFVPAVYVHDSPAWIVFESKPPAFDVAV